MSGLAHYLEDEGIATVVIALVREHAEQMRPPRALWVPFMLGRPFGEPNNPQLQSTVIRQAFALLSAESGPILIDAEVPENESDEEGVWACPVSFPNHAEDNNFSARVDKEISELRPWYELGVERRNRTTVGLSPDSPEESAKALAQFVEAPEHHRKLPDPVKTGNSLRWWASDLKAFYLEAVTAQPGEVEAQQLEYWFWRETAAGDMLLRLRQQCLEHEAEQIREIGLYMIGELESQYYVEAFLQRDAD